VTTIKIPMKLGAFAIGLCFLTTGFAHEPRDNVADGAYNIVVGYSAEPVYAGVANGMDLTIRNPDGSAADVQDIDLDITVLYLETDAMDSKVKASALLTGELRRNRSTPNNFDIDFMATRAGAYGFIIKGMIDGNMIDEKFVCGGGSQNPEGRSFGCTGSLQKFPGGKKHRDDD